MAALQLQKLAFTERDCRMFVLQLQELSITGEEHMGSWAVGIDSIPKSWAALTNLRKLELRGHVLLQVP